MCFDGAVGAARGFGIGAGCVVAVAALLSVLLETAFCFSSHTFMLLISDIVAHCRQNRAVSSLSLLCRRYWRCACVKGMMIEMSDTADVLTMLLILLHLRCKE